MYPCRLFCRPMVEPPTVQSHSIHNSLYPILNWIPHGACAEIHWWGQGYRTTIQSWDPAGSWRVPGGFGNEAHPVSSTQFWEAFSALRCWICLTSLGQSVTKVGSFSGISPLVKVSFILSDNAIWREFCWGDWFQSRLAAITWTSLYDWGNSQFVCWISCMFSLAVATWLGFPNAASWRWILAGRSSRPIVQLSLRCGRMWHRDIPRTWLNVYSILDCFWAKLVGLCHITIWSLATQPFNWVGSDRENCWEYGNFRTLLSRWWGAVGATLADNVKAFSNCVLKLRTSSLDRCASWLPTANTCCSSSSVPGVKGLVRSVGDFLLELVSDSRFG